MKVTCESFNWTHCLLAVKTAKIWVHPRLARWQRVPTASLAASLANGHQPSEIWETIQAWIVILWWICDGIPSGFLVPIALHQLKTPITRKEQQSAVIPNWSFDYCQQNMDPKRRNGRNWLTNSTAMIWLTIVNKTWTSGLKPSWVKIESETKKNEISTEVREFLLYVS